ncbi:hypothetical protein D3C80_788460 [compost metagenome]
MKIQLAIATASDDMNARVSTDVRAVIAKSYSSLFSNVFYQVLDIPDRSKSDIRLVKEMEDDYIPVVVTVEDADHNKVTFVFAAHRMQPMLGNANPTKGWLLHGNKVDEFTLESRVIKVRGVAFAIAAMVARRASRFIDFGNN